MIAKNCTIADLYKALELTNEKFNGNVTFNREPEFIGKNIRFTLRVISSKDAGHRRGFSFGERPAKRLTSACWHVHGKFFDALILNVNSNAVIVSRSDKMQKNEYHNYVDGNWEDTNIGSIYNPLYFSEACDCE